jgi:type IV pilus assembly protein PilA
MNPSSQNAPTSKLAIASIVLSLLCCWPLGIVLGVVALIRIEGSKGALGGKTLAIVALVISVLAGPGMGVLAAIAVPNFMQFQCRSKQSEAKGNLKALFVSEESHRADRDTYSADIATIGFAPRGQTLRYEYRIVSADKESFVAEAVGLAEMTGDLWRISNKNDLVNVDNVCGR